jgi:hypothetical protein
MESTITLACGVWILTDSSVPNVVKAAATISIRVITESTRFSRVVQYHLHAIIRSCLGNHTVHNSITVSVECSRFGEKSIKLRDICMYILPLSHITPLDPSIRKNSGILSKRHVILVELNETCSCIYNIKCGRKSLNVHNRVCLQKNCGTSIAK